MSRLRAIVLAVVLGAGVGTGVVGAGPALAAGSAPAPTLVASSPAAGAVLTQAPSVVALTFDRPVRPDGSSLTVVDETGSTRSVAAVAGSDGRRLRFELDPALGSGRTLMGWTAQGSGAEGRGAFVVVVDPTGSGAVAVERAVSSAPGVDAAWWASLVGLGAMVVLAVVLGAEAAGGRRARPMLLGAVLALALGAGLLALGAAGLDADGGLADLAGVDPWSAAPDADAGRRWAMAVLFVLVVPAVLVVGPGRRGGRPARLVAAALLVGAAGLATVAAADARSQSSAPARAEVTLDGAEIAVELVPGRTGVNEAHVYATDADGQPAALPEGTFAVTHQVTGVGPLVVDVTTVAPGHLVASVVDLPLAGPWTVALVPSGAGDPSATLTLEVPR